jgi:hypothetical protein
MTIQLRFLKHLSEESSKDEVVGEITLFSEVMIQ